MDKQKSAARKSINTGAFQVGTPDLYIGCPDTGAYDRGCHCWVEEVKVYEKALTDPDIYALSDQFHQNLPHIFNAKGWRIRGDQNQNAANVSFSGKAPLNTRRIFLYPIRVGTGPRNPLSSAKRYVESGHNGGREPSTAFEDNNNACQISSKNGIFWIGVEFKSAVTVRSMKIELYLTHLREFEIQTMVTPYVWKTVCVCGENNDTTKNGMVYTFTATW